MILARNNEYREKIKDHKHLFWEMESKLPVMIELARKKAVVEELKAKKEELICDLQNPEGSVIKQMQVLYFLFDSFLLCEIILI